MPNGASLRESMSDKELAEAANHEFFFNSMTMKPTRVSVLGLRILLTNSLLILGLLFGLSALYGAETVQAPLRLGIPEFVTGGDAASLRGEGARLVDLLTARLSREAGFELVE